MCARLCGCFGAQGKTAQYHAITNNKGVTGEREGALKGALKGALHNAIEGEGRTKLWANFDLDVRGSPVVRCLFAGDHM